MTILKATATTAVIALLAAPALADTVEYNLTEPDNFSNPNEDPTPGNASEEPAIATDTTGSLGNGSWQADPTLGPLQQHLIYMQAKGFGTVSPDQGGQTSYETPGLNPNLLYSTADTVTYNDLVSISFDTNSANSDDWFVNLTTNFDGNQDSQFDAAKGNLVASDAANGFTTYTFSDAGGTVYSDADLRDGGGLTQYTLGALQQQFGSNEINLVSLATNSSNLGFAGNVDNFRFTYLDSDGMEQTSVIDFEPAASAAIPVPAALPLLAGGIGLLAGVGRLRRKS